MGCARERSESQQPGSVTTGRSPVERLLRLLPIPGNFDATATQVEILRTSACILQQIGPQLVDHEAAVAFHFHQPRILQDFEVVRNGDDFRFQKLGNVADGHFAMPKNIDNPQP